MFYWRGEPTNQVWVVDVQTGPAFSASKPRLLFEQRGFGYSGVHNWEISSDGQRCLMVKLDDWMPTPVTEMILVQTWFEELKRLAPSGKK